MQRLTLFRLWNCNAHYLRKVSGIVSAQHMPPGEGVYTKWRVSLLSTNPCFLFLIIFNKICENYLTVVLERITHSSRREKEWKLREIYCNH